MKKKIKRAMCCLVATLLLSQSAAFSYISSCYPAVSAEEYEKYTGADLSGGFVSDVENIYRYLKTAVFGMLGGSGSAEDLNKKEIVEKYDGIRYVYEDGTVYREYYKNKPNEANGVLMTVRCNKDGSLTIDDETVETVHDIIESNTNYWIIQPALTADELVKKTFANVSNLNVYDVMLKVVGEHDYAMGNYIYYDKWKELQLFDDETEVYFYPKDDGVYPGSYDLRCVDENLKSPKYCNVATYNLQYVKDGTLVWNYVTEYDAGAYSVMGAFERWEQSLCGHSIVIWKTKQDVVNAVNGYGPVPYMSNEYKNFNTDNDNSETVSGETLFQTDWDAFEESVKESVEDALMDTNKNLDNVAETISNQTDELLKALEKVEESVEENTGILEKILKEVKSIGKTLKAMFIVDVVEDIADKIDNGVENAVEDVKGAVGDVVDTASTRFPMSLPWDIGALVGFLAAEPQAPYWEIPVKVDSMGISEKIVIDFAPFEDVAKIVRGMLILIFLMMLVWLTYRFTDNGGDDS